MTRTQYAGALVVLFVGGVLGGLITPKVRPVHAAGAKPSTRRSVPQQMARPKLTIAAPLYFTSARKMGNDKVPSLRVWYYGKEERYGRSFDGPLRQVRMERAPADLQGEPTDWEYVFVPSPEDEQVVLYRYRVYPKQGKWGTPVAEYKVLEWAWEAPPNIPTRHGYPLDSQRPEECKTRS